MWCYCPLGYPKLFRGMMSEALALILLDIVWDYGYIQWIQWITMVFVICLVIMINFRSLIVLMALDALHPCLGMIKMIIQNGRNEMRCTRKCERPERPWKLKRPWVPKNYFYF